MLLCLAGGVTRAHIQIWFGDHGVGFLDLFQRKQGATIHLTSNPSAAKELEYKLPPEAAVVELACRAVNANLAGEERPVYLQISQNGSVLPIIEEGGGTVNGNGPYHEFRLAPDAPHNQPKFYYFNLKFA